jgi:hypothetical protein
MPRTMEEELSEVEPEDVLDPHLAELLRISRPGFIHLVKNCGGTRVYIPLDTSYVNRGRNRRAREKVNRNGGHLAKTQ